ncbi:murein-DD-endopeptidase [Burkholderia pseudomallei]|nr:murein-DD-endopeptidase [Burkholderia pseudomallei]CAJ4659830.1 murein-DD-endopeptidase [Burkholderia pseudomallei]
MTRARSHTRHTAHGAFAAFRYLSRPRATRCRVVALSRCRTVAPSHRRTVAPSHRRIVASSRCPSAFDAVDTINIAVAENFPTAPRSYRATRSFDSLPLPVRSPCHPRRITQAASPSVCCSPSASSGSRPFWASDSRRPLTRRARPAHAHRLRTATRVAARAPRMRNTPSAPLARGIMRRTRNTNARPYRERPDIARARPRIGIIRSASGRARRAIPSSRPRSRNCSRAAATPPRRATCCAHARSTSSMSARVRC